MQIRPSKFGGSFNYADATNGFEYYKAEFAIKENDGTYTLCGATLVVRIDKNNKPYVYDFVTPKIKKKGLILTPSKTVSGMGLTSNTMNSRSPSEPNVPQSDEEVNSVMNEGTDLRRSLRVTDKQTLDFLENQEHIKTYRTFQLIDGGLYAPMNKGSYRGEIGKWEQATEDTSLVKDGKFPLKAGNNTDSGKNRTTWAAYNPYLHSSNLVFNKYDPPNLEGRSTKTVIFQKHISRI